MIRFRVHKSEDRMTYSLDMTSFKSHNQNSITSETIVVSEILFMGQTSHTNIEYFFINTKIMF
jgi:hypothetical protein